MSIERAKQLLDQLGDHYWYASEGSRGPKPSYQAASQRVLQELRQEFGANSVLALIELLPRAGEHLSSGPSFVAVEAAQALGRIGNWRAVEPLMSALAVGQTEHTRWLKDPYTSAFQTAGEFSSACREALERIGGVRLKELAVQLTRLGPETAQLATKLGSRRFRENAPGHLVTQEEGRLKELQRNLEALRAELREQLKSHA